MVLGTPEGRMMAAPEAAAPVKGSAPAGAGAVHGQRPAGRIYGVLRSMVGGTARPTGVGGPCVSLGIRAVTTWTESSGRAVGGVLGAVPSTLRGPADPVRGHRRVPGSRRPVIGQCLTVWDVG